MAEFGPQATQLAAPQGAGSSPVRPATEQYVNTTANTISLLDGVVDIFNKGLVANGKAEAQKRQDDIVGGYVRDEVALNNAVSTGQISATQAASRSRANFNKYAASNPEYIQEFEKSGKALRGFTEKGEVEKELETDAKRREADIQQASQRGFIFPEGMDKKAQDSQITAAKASVVADAELTRLYQRNSEARAQGTFNQAVADRDTKEVSIRLINEIAGTNLTAFQDLGTTLSDQVKSGKLTPDQAQFTLAERFTRVNGAIQSASGVNPELAGSYRNLFNEMNDVFKKQIDPKTALESQKDALESIIVRMKLAAVADPKVAAAVALSNLMGNTPDASLSIGTLASQTIARISAIAPGQQGYTPQVVGNPDVEGSVLKVLKSAVNKLESPNVTKKDLMQVEASNSMNVVLKQTGDFLNAGATPERLKGLAEFFASPEYAKVATSGTMNKEAAGAAKKTFQLVYEPAVKDGVQVKLNEYLYGQARSSAAPKLLSEALSVKFTGSGIVFEPKNVALDPVERESQKDAVRDLQTSQRAINQLIRIGAHMEGTTDYGKYWEDNKHIWLPNMYSRYDGLEIGTVKNGYKYKGGDANKSSSWEKADGGN